MSIHSVDGTPEIQYVDAVMLGMHEVSSPYILDTPEPTVVDTGTADAEDEILAGLDNLGISRDEVSYIIPTHAHLDHAGSAGALAAACPSATVICHKKGVDYLTDEKMLTHLTESVERAIGMDAPYGEPQQLDRERCQVVSGGERIDLGDRNLEVIDAPGHAPHQLCLFDTVSELLFSADAAGMEFPDEGLRPTTPPPNFDLEAALETIDRLLAVEPETILYAHYGPGEIGAGVAELRQYREMLPAYVDRIAELRAEHGDDIGAIAAAMEPQWGHWSLTTDIAGVIRYLDGGAETNR